MNTILPAPEALLRDVSLPKNLDPARQLVLLHISPTLTCLDFLHTSRSEIILKLPPGVLSSKDINSTERLRNHLSLKLEFDPPVFELDCPQGVIRIIDDKIQFLNQSRSYTKDQLHNYSAICYRHNRGARNILENAGTTLNLPVPKLSISVLLYDWYPKARAACRSARDQHQLMILFSEFLLAMLDAVDVLTQDPTNRSTRIVSNHPFTVTLSTLDESLTVALFNYLDIEPDPEYIIAMLCWFGIDECKSISLDRVGNMFMPALSRTAVKDRIHRSIDRYSAFLDVHPENIWRCISNQGICGLREFLSHFSNVRMAFRFLCLLCDQVYSPDLLKQLWR